MPQPSKRIVFSYQQLSNTGCEIIIRGAIKFLQRAFPDHNLEFIVSSYHVHRDRALLSDIPGVIIAPMLTWKRYLRFALRKTGRFDQFWSPRFSSKIFRSADLFVSVGGDIYTMFDGQLPEDWLGYEAYATRHGIPSIMFGANMERFEVLGSGDLKKLELHLKRFKLLAVRDRGTATYLAKNNIVDNVEVFPDPIFLLRSTSEFARKEIVNIGLNITPILVSTFGEAIVDRYAKIAEDLIRAGYNINLIPHVHSSDGDASLDDRLVLSRLYDKISVNLREAVGQYGGPMSFLELGREIAKTDLFIGGRMHGCLNALTQGKAVCFLGYSRKAATMVDWLSTESPFSVVKGSYIALDADIVDTRKILELIDAHNSWASEGGSPVVVHTSEYLDGMGVWCRMMPIFDQVA